MCGTRDTLSIVTSGSVEPPSRSWHRPVLRTSMICHRTSHVHVGAVYDHADSDTDKYPLSSLLLLKPQRDVNFFSQNLRQDHVQVFSFFYRAMIRRARWCYSKSSVRLSVCLSVTFSLIQVCFFSHRLEYFENNFTAEWLKVPAQLDLNIGDGPTVSITRLGLRTTGTQSDFSG